MISSTPGIVISAAGTLLLLVLFVFQLKDYLAIGSETSLVVDELVDDTLRVNFNVTLHEVRQALAPAPLTPAHQAATRSRRPSQPTEPAAPAHRPTRGPRRCRASTLRSTSPT